MFAVALTFDRIRTLIDVKIDFVNAPLNQSLYIQQQEGLVISGPEEYVYHLNKFLYGLRQASCEWHIYLDNFFY